MESPKSQEAHIIRIVPQYDLIERDCIVEHKSVSSVASDSAASIDTPTYTMAADDASGRASPSCGTELACFREAIPHSGQTFAIRERNTGRFITLIEGSLQVKHNTGDQGGWHWVCTDFKGWLGFRSPVSGTYMGHDTQGNFWAKYSHHLGHESFCARKHPDGGYLLLMRHDDELWKMAISDDGCSLIETTGSGTQWDFVKV
ncbi:hypothetical protein F5Y04DRAFT_251136 [Hypomontagnella monticulosa]|nr:hypothetical protein F5Y04DRAFT_251136 [Hypomontagnella monticulosa]